MASRAVKEFEKVTWTHFYDMSSGGSEKLDWQHIFAELPEQLAIGWFMKEFDRDPRNVTCDCCGPDYAIHEYASLKEATAFQRNCRAAILVDQARLRVIMQTGSPAQRAIYRKTPPSLGRCYMEKGDPLPSGWQWQYSYQEEEDHWQGYQTLEQFAARDDVLIYEPPRAIASSMTRNIIRED